MPPGKRRNRAYSDACKYCPYEFTDDTLATINHLRSHADIFAEQGLAEAKLADLDRWEQNHLQEMSVDG